MQTDAGCMMPNQGRAKRGLSLWQESQDALRRLDSKRNRYFCSVSHLLPMCMCPYTAFRGRPIIQCHTAEYAKPASPRATKKHELGCSSTSAQYSMPIGPIVKFISSNRPKGSGHQINSQPGNIPHWADNFPKFRQVGSRPLSFFHAPPPRPFKSTDPSPGHRRPPARDARHQYTVREDRKHQDGARIDR